MCWRTWWAWVTSTQKEASGKGRDKIFAVWKVTFLVLVDEVRAKAVAMGPGA